MSEIVLAVTEEEIELEKLSTQQVETVSPSSTLSRGGMFWVGGASIILKSIFESI